MARSTAISLAAAMALFVPHGAASACVAPWGTINFEFGSAALLERHWGYLASFVPSARQGGSIIRLTGHADRAGSAVFNQRLSRRRAEAARDYLVSLGFPRTSIEVVAVGEERPILETPDGVAELQNRYVMIEELPTPAEAARRANTIPPHPIC